MALKTLVVGRPEGDGAFRVKVEDELIGVTALKVVYLAQCMELAGEAIPDLLAAGADVVEGIARTIAVREYLAEIGEDPDRPTLG